MSFLSLPEKKGQVRRGCTATNTPDHQTQQQQPPPPPKSHTILEPPNLRTRRRTGNVAAWISTSSPSPSPFQFVPEQSRPDHSQPRAVNPKVFTFTTKQDPSDNEEMVYSPPPHFLSSQKGDSPTCTRPPETSERGKGETKYSTQVFRSAHSQPGNAGHVPDS